MIETDNSAVKTWGVGDNRVERVIWGKKNICNTSNNNNKLNNKEKVKANILGF